MQLITGKDLVKKILLDPATDMDCDEFRVVSGYSTSAMASRHIELLKDEKKSVKIKVLIGMTPKDGMVDVQHEGFKKLMEYYPSSFECSYNMVNRLPCHAKVYIWLKNGVPRIAFLGSANYTHNAFYGFQREVLYECDPVAANEFYESFVSDTIYCNHCEVEDTINILNREQYRKRNVRIEEAVGSAVDCQGLEHVSFSLLTKDGDPGNAGNRLNWGQREGRNKNQAYLHIPSNIAKSGFFPPRKQQFTVLTDDAKSMLCVIAQDGGKGLQTTNDNGELGRYFRTRLGLESGSYVTADDLNRYGRTSVTFCKIDNETYYMDFSKNNA